MDGLRACLTDEFTSVYVFNLRGNQRTAANCRDRKAGRSSGREAARPSPSPLLVKNPEKSHAVRIRYHDIGDYLPRTRSCRSFAEYESINGIEAARRLDEQSSPTNESIGSASATRRFDDVHRDRGQDGNEARHLFETYSMGVATGRDKWCYNISADCGSQHEANDQICTTTS